MSNYKNLLDIFQLSLKPVIIGKIYLVPTSIFSRKLCMKSNIPEIESSMKRDYRIMEHDYQMLAHFSCVNLSLPPFFDIEQTIQSFCPKLNYYSDFS